MLNRTDLALECYEEKEKTKLSGVKIREDNNLTTVEVLNDDGVKAIGKPVGKYYTLKLKSFVNDTDLLDGRLELFSSVLSSLLPDGVSSVLVIGLGNKKITADALGPVSSEFILSTRHITSDAKFDTGIESAEIVNGIVSQINPSCVITVDALAASSAERLGTTVQFSDSGISPGSGVGNHRHEISKKTLGIPVISIGIPTVVNTAVIGSSDEPLFVTPREIDRIIQQGAKLIGMGINVCLQKNLSVEDLLALVG